METIMVRILVGIMFLLCIYLGYLFCMTTLLYDWDNYSRDYIRMKFKTFLSFYAINPDRWRLYCDCIEYCPNNTSFGFNLIDWVRYKIWKRRLNKWRTKQEHLKKYQSTLELIKKDLEKFTRENDEMMKRETEKYQKQVEDILFM